jgi:hypothetical protein
MRLSLPGPAANALRWEITLTFSRRKRKKEKKREKRKRGWVIIAGLRAGQDLLSPRSEIEFVKKF